MTDKFAKFLSELNTRQKEAVLAIDGPVMVVAGPGTGKTQVLTLRIANILRETDTEPENILALTFTESGVISMRRRLSEIIGSQAYGVNISTFHGFCNSVIKDFPEYFPRIIGSENITEVDQIRITEEAITETKLEYLKPFGDPLHYLRPIISAINKLKNEAVSPEELRLAAEKEKKDFEEISDLYHDKGKWKGEMKGKYRDLEKKIIKNLELARIYDVYQKKLAAAKLYDYSDMIMEALRAMREDENLLLSLQEKYQYILVDEHQDTNNAQNKILELLCDFHENPNIFVVGDEKQAIFRFQGASIQNFLYFQKLYPTARLIVLTDNYRSTQSILDAADSLISGRAPLKSSVLSKGEKIKLFEFSRPEAENYFLAKAAAEKISSGVKSEDIAILYRENRDAAEIAKALDKFNIPFIIESESSVLDDLDIRKLVQIMKAVDNFGNETEFIKAMHTDISRVEILDVYRLVEASRKTSNDIFYVFSSPEKFAAVNLINREAAIDFYSKLKFLAEQAKNTDLVSFFETLVRESGFLKYVLSKSGASEKVEKLNRLFDEIKSVAEARHNVTLKDFLEYLAIMEKHGVNLKTAAAGAKPDKVRLMTAHRAKGQEFSVVFIAGASDGHWGNKRVSEKLPIIASVLNLLDRLEEGDSEDDERRLFYVALTRAKNEAVISFSRTNRNGKETMVSKFVSEINSEMLERGEAESYEKELVNNPEFFFSAPKVTDEDEKEFVRTAFDRRPLSATALNNFLECPWKYFYSNLLHLPEASQPHLLYGTAVHNALADFFLSVKERGADKQFLLDKFEFHLRREPFQENAFDDFLEEGRKSLAGYFDKWNQEWNFNVLTELRVPEVVLTDGIKLTGKLDKLEFISAGCPDVNVVDYKTGRPKTRGVIEGSTKNSEGNIKRQIVFYNLLLNLWQNGRYKMVSAEVDFTEPDDKGRYRKEKFEILPEEIEELKALISRVAKEITVFEFRESRCDKKDCKFCALRELTTG